MSQMLQFWKLQTQDRHKLYLPIVRVGITNPEAMLAPEVAAAITK